MLYLVMDNRVYGMTKGQPSPTSEPDWDSDLIPGGTKLRPFNHVATAIVAGATFVARGFSADPQGLADLITAGIRWRGFAFIEVLSPCITFRAEEFEWKTRVRQTGVLVPSDRGGAISTSLEDDGFDLGILFRDNEPAADVSATPKTTPDALEQLFLMPRIAAERRA